MVMAIGVAAGEGGAGGDKAITTTGAAAVELAVAEGEAAEGEAVGLTCPN